MFVGTLNNEKPVIAVKMAHHHVIITQAQTVMLMCHFYCMMTGFITQAHLG